MNGDGIDIGAIFPHEGEKLSDDGIEASDDGQVVGGIEDDGEGDSGIVLAFPALFGEASDAGGAVPGRARAGGTG